MAKILQRNSVPGAIEPGSLYLADEARQRLRMGTWAWRQARRAGLQVVYHGRNAYVFGDDVLAYFRRVQSSQVAGEVLQ